MCAMLSCIDWSPGIQRLAVSLVWNIACTLSLVLCLHCLYMPHMVLFWRPRRRILLLIGALLGSYGTRYLGHLPRFVVAPAVRPIAEANRIRS